nr:MAG TPA: hypothetical protein [Caudoviricetes sp.]
MLDLKKLRALELPKKQISVEILGDEQKLEIQALDDETAIKIAAIANSATTTDEDREVKIRREILRNGVVGISDDDVDIIMKKAAAVATEIMVGIRDLTTEYGESRNATRDEIKKKSNPATSETENS